MSNTRNAHVYVNWLVTRTGGRPERFHPLGTEDPTAEQRAREFAAATPQTGFPVLIQTEENYRACQMGPHDPHRTRCAWCENATAIEGELRAFPLKRFLDNNGEPDSRIVHQELIQRS